MLSIYYYGNDKDISRARRGCLLYRIFTERSQHPLFFVSNNFLIKADISIAVDPLYTMRHQNQRAPQLGSLSPLFVAAGFNTAPCCLTLHLDSSLYSITQIIREARILAYNGRQVFFSNFRLYHFTLDFNFHYVL